jgi:hypothetical protein
VLAPALAPGVPALAPVEAGKLQAPVAVDRNRLAMEGRKGAKRVYRYSIQD